LLKDLNNYGQTRRLSAPNASRKLFNDGPVGAALASPNVSSVFWPNLIYGFITGAMLTAASMTINDYYDREIDAINEPNSKWLN